MQLLCFRLCKNSRRVFKFSSNIRQNEMRRRDTMTKISLYSTSKAKISYTRQKWRTSTTRQSMTNRRTMNSTKRTRVGYLSSQSKITIMIRATTKMTKDGSTREDRISRQSCSRNGSRMTYRLMRGILTSIRVVSMKCIRSVQQDIGRITACIIFQKTR